ncbi:MAG: DUF5110 domain-containing protein [Muribaculaceae bacterium]|nr:DUF5110 domain-containing protein [Muribaculaceae bacterium]
MGHSKIWGIILFISLFTFSIKAFPVQFVSSQSRGMKIEINAITPEIIRVLKYPVGTDPEIESLVVIKKAEDIDVKIFNEGNKKVLQTKYLKISLDTLSGVVEFRNGKNDLLLSECFTSFTPENKKEYYNVRTGFLIEPEEPIYGIGQVMDGKFNRRGSKHHLQNENMFTYSPYFMSPTKGYAVYSDNYSIQDFIDNDQILEFSQLGVSSDYYFIFGNTPDKIIAGIRELTGHAPMLPLWAYGFFQSKERYKTQQEVLEVLKRYRKLGVPIDVMIQDWRYWPEYEGTDSLWNAQRFDKERYPDPQKWIDVIHKEHGRLMVVTWPGFGPKTPQYQTQDSLGHLLPFHTWPPASGALPYDVFSDEARDIYWKYLDKGIFSYIGNDGWWLDSTEPDHIDVKPQDFEASTAKGEYKTVKNAYSLMHNRGIAEHQKNQNKNKRVVILTRSGHIGQQRYGSNTWSGDVVSRWEVLKNQIPAALNYTIMGIPNWNSDIGGFFAWDWKDENGNMKTGFPELYTRWAQFGAFTPMMRSHGTDLPREIWNFGEPGDKYFEAIADAIKLRYRLLPYNYSTSWDVSSNDGTFMRPLFMDYPDDPNVYDIGDEYLWGRNILVSPITDPETNNWKVYLPAGNDWWDFNSNNRLEGGQSIDISVDIATIPLFVKAGSIIPIGPDVQYSDEKAWDNLDIIIYPGTDGTFTLYEDEFDNYNYEKGMYSTITFNWDDDQRIITIGEREGDFPGILKSRKFNFKIVENARAGEESNPTKNETVKYNGKQKIIRF